MGVGPNVDAVQRDKDGDIADNADATLVGIVFDSQPLLEELPLLIFMALNLLGQLLPPTAQRPRLPGDDSRLPFVPRA